MDNLTGKPQPINIPQSALAKIVIEQKPNGSFSLVHNLKPWHFMKVFALIIDLVASQNIQQEMMIIDPNKPRLKVDIPIMEPETPKSEVS